MKFFGNGTYRLSQEKYEISSEMKSSDIKDVFDFVASCTETFLAGLRAVNATSGGKHFDMGFTFSFPVQQVGLKCGRILFWNKGFNLQNSIGQDVVVLLQSAFDARHLPIRVNALVNDTVGTLAAHQCVDPATQVGIILGTGTNASYYERVSEIKALDGASFPVDHTMAINTGVW